MFVSIFQGLASAIVVFAMTNSAAMVTTDVSNEFVVAGQYEDVRYDLEDAIISRGLSVDHVSHVATMLERTAGVVAGAKKIYLNGEQIQFCSAVLSRHSMQADPANIVFCPYQIYLYESADEPGKVHMGFRRLDEIGSAQSKEAIRAVNNLLTEIITEASGN